MVWCLPVLGLLDTVSDADLEPLFSISLGTGSGLLFIVFDLVVLLPPGGSGGASALGLVHTVCLVSGL